MMKRTPLKPILRVVSLLLAAMLLAAACGSADSSVASTESAQTDAVATAEPIATTEPLETPAEAATPAETATTEPAAATAVPAEATAEPVAATVSETGTAAATGAAAALSCDEIAASFVTQGSANADLADPEVAATCTGDSVVVTSNQIPDFPYIETSPGVPETYDLEFTIPATPVLADETSEIAALGAIAVAINGVPIYGATEGTGGDVMSLNGGFTECGGHNGPTGYHFHTFDVTGSDDCLFSADEASVEPVLFGYAFDGFPIYGGNFFYTSSWELTDASLFASDTFSAHTYIEGSGDLDECNGRTDEDGNYAYYTTDTFPYTLGCYRGVVSADANSGGPGGGQGGPPGGAAPAGGPPADGAAAAGGPPADGAAADDAAPAGGPPGGGAPDFTDAAATLGVTVEALQAALGEPPFDLDAAAAILGVTAQELEAALPAPPGPPGG